MKTQTGFTLVELMVTLAVFGILAIAAVPAFHGYVTSNRLITETNSMVGTLNYARNEAITHRATVSVCRSEDGATCATSAGAWNVGWIVFLNADNDSPAQVDTGETILRVYGIFNDPMLASTNLANFITYNANGYSNAQGTFVLCDTDNTTSSARTLSVSRSGRVSPDPGNGTCTPT